MDEWPHVGPLLYAVKEDPFEPARVGKLSHAIKDLRDRARWARVEPDPEPQAGGPHLLVVGTHLLDWRNLLPELGHFLSLRAGSFTVRR